MTNIKRKNGVNAAVIADYKAKGEIKKNEVEGKADTIMNSLRRLAGD